MLLNDITTSNAMETWKKGSFASIVIFRRIDHALLPFVVSVFHFAIFQTFEQRENTLTWVLIDDSFYFKFSVLLFDIPSISRSPSTYCICSDLVFDSS